MDAPKGTRWKAVMVGSEVADFDSQMTADFKQSCLALEGESHVVELRIEFAAILDVQGVNSVNADPFPFHGNVGDQKSAVPAADIPPGVGDDDLLAVEVAREVVFAFVLDEHGDGFDCCGFVFVELVHGEIPVSWNEVK